MSLSDPLGDLLTRIRNAQRARHAACVAPASKLRASVLEALRRELSALLSQCRKGRVSECLIIEALRPA